MADEDADTPHEWQTSRRAGARCGAIDYRPDCLLSACVDALSSANLDEKVGIVNVTAKAWFSRTLSLSTNRVTKVPFRPGRPSKPDLVPPTEVKKRSLKSRRGRIALLHAIAHIELNAIDLALDIIARFATEPMPRSFFDGWMKVAFEEAKHFTLLRNRLAEFDAAYGDLPAHDGLWEAAQQTGHDLGARLAIVPLVLEARGLDITPSLLVKLEELGDHETARIFRIIYEDEKGHVAIGAKWFRFLCHKQGKPPAETFRKMVKTHFRGGLKPPFNDMARARCGLPPSFYRNLSPAGN